MLCFRLLLPAALLIVTTWVVCAPLAATAGASANDRARKFVKAHEAKLRPLEIEANRAWWDANVSGKDADFQHKIKAQNRIDEALADPAAFREVKAIKEAAGIHDPILAPQMDLRYLTDFEK